MSKTKNLRVGLNVPIFIISLKSRGNYRTNISMESSVYQQNGPSTEDEQMNDRNQTSTLWNI
ncbi:hypothetical protein M3Y95_00159100 [Aphelenchoides besseyi]|nr:hypothetical protein M3Y95_00159100 [Aphelenchoides besseyi]